MVAIECGPSDEMISALADLWHLRPPGPENILKEPAFLRLREACRDGYPNMGCSGPNFALSTALRSLGLPCLLSPNAAPLALSVADAAVLLDAAASGDPPGARTSLGLQCASARGKLRKRRASSATSRKSMKPQLSRITSRRSPYSDEAASVQRPAAPGPDSGPLSRTNIDRPGVLRTSPTVQQRPWRRPLDR